MYIAIAIIIATVLGIIFIIGLVRLIIGLVKKKNSNEIIITNEGNEIETIEEVNKTNEN